jgi:hypothetical protein
MNYVFKNTMVNSWNPQRKFSLLTYLLANPHIRSQKIVEIHQLHFKVEILHLMYSMPL